VALGDHAFGTELAGAREHRGTVDLELLRIAKEVVLIGATEQELLAGALARFEG
jgi:hypothetical protein